MVISENKIFCNCMIIKQPKNKEGFTIYPYKNKCSTCKSLAYHNSIYGGLSSNQAMKLYKERTLKAFERGLI